MLECALYAVVVIYVVYRVVKRVKTPNFEGQTVWITGASSGIGKALALEFSLRGANLILTARSEGKLIDVRDACLTAGAQRVDIVPMDLEDVNGVMTRGRDVAAHQRIDVLVHSAGIGQRTLVEEIPDFISIEEKLLTVNTLAPIALTKAVLPYMLKHKRGHIVGINSIQGLMGVPMRAGYSASKFALKQFLWSVRSELYFRGIRTSNIYPGYVQTDFSSNALNDQMQHSGIPDDNSHSAMSPHKFASIAVRAIYWRDQEVIISSLKFQLAALLREWAPSLLRILQKGYLEKQVRVRDAARLKRD